MVKIFTVKSVCADDSKEHQGVHAPNRFHVRIRSYVEYSVEQPVKIQGNSYDRSVFDDESCDFGENCKCYQCDSKPVVVLSRGESSSSARRVALRNLQTLVERGLVQPLSEDSFFIYSQADHAGNEQFGVLAAIDVEDCRNNVVKRHENVIKTSLPGKHLIREVVSIAFAIYAYPYADQHHASVPVLRGGPGAAHVPRERRGLGHRAAHRGHVRGRSAAAGRRQQCRETAVVARWRRGRRRSAARRVRGGGQPVHRRRPPPHRRGLRRIHVSQSRRVFLVFLTVCTDICLPARVCCAPLGEWRAVSVSVCAACDRSVSGSWPPCCFPTRSCACCRIIAACARCTGSARRHFCRRCAATSLLAAVPSPVLFVAAGGELRGAGPRPPACAGRG